MAEREELLNVARAVAARLPVDWGTVESSASDESLRAAIRELKVIAEIAELHRSLPVSSSLRFFTRTSGLTPAVPRILRDIARPMP